MSRADALALALVVLCANAPLAVVVLVALTRGYAIHVSMRRPPRTSSRDRRGGRQSGG